MTSVFASSRGYLCFTESTIAHQELVLSRLADLHIAVMDAENFQAWAPLPQLNLQYLQVVRCPTAEVPQLVIPAPEADPMRSVVVATLDDDLGGWMEILPRASTVFVLIDTAPVQLIDALGTIRQAMHSDHVSIVALEATGGRYAIEYNKQVAHRRPSPKTTDPSSTSVAIAIAEILHRHIFLSMPLEQAIQLPATAVRNIRGELTQAVKELQRVNGSPFLHHSGYDRYLTVIKHHQLTPAVVWFQPVKPVSPLRVEALGHATVRFIRAMDAAFLLPTGAMCFMVLTDSAAGLVSVRTRLVNAVESKAPPDLDGIFEVESSILLTEDDIDWLRSRIDEALRYRSTAVAAD